MIKLANKADFEDIEDNPMKELLELHAVPWNNKDLFELGSQFWCYDIFYSVWL
jgi:hypothetical protein